jgi:hypothetical protein
MSPARRQPNDAALREWVAELEAAASIARQLAPTAFLPDSHRRYHMDERGFPLNGKDGRAYRLDVEATTATAAAAIMTGKELGLDVMASLRSIAIINNTPALSALTLRAILQNAGHDIWVVAESNATRAIVRARRAGTDDVQQSVWTLDRAKTLGLYPGTERSQWRRQPTAMLVARATAEAARWVAADAILGIPYVAEELTDQIEGADPLAIEGGAAAIEAGNGEAPGSKRRRTQRKSRAALPALPSGPPGGQPIAPVGEPERADLDAEPESIRKPQLDRLHIVFRELGWDRATALAHIADWIGHKITSTKNLTADEAHTVLGNVGELRKLAGQEAPGQAAGAEDVPLPDTEPPL